MKFSPSLLKGKFIRRYKRFFMEAELETGETIVAHCPNTGAMRGLLTPGCEVYVEHIQSETRKLLYTWHISQHNQTLVGVNTHSPNQIVAEAIDANLLPDLTGYMSMRREVRYGYNSRIDILLDYDHTPPVYVEVKNVHHIEVVNGQRIAMFPDSVTTRGAKHMQELMDVVAAGGKAMVVFVIQRNDVDAFSPAHHIDPAYAEVCRKAYEAGVEMRPFSCLVNKDEIKLEKEIPFLPYINLKGIE